MRSLLQPLRPPRRRPCPDRSATRTPSPSFQLSDLERARAFYRDKLGLEPIEERSGGLRYVCGSTEFHLFSSAGTPSGESTQMAFEVEDLDARLADVRSRGVVFERFEMPGFGDRGDTIVALDNYPSKGTGELGAFFYDSEGNLIGIAQPVREARSVAKS